MQSHSHAEYLGSLTGEDEDGLATGCRRAADDRLDQVVPGQLIQAGEQDVALTADEDGPVLEVRPTRQ